MSMYYIEGTRLCEADLDAAIEDKSAFRRQCSGPFQQGRKECETPMACEVADETADHLADYLMLALAMIAIGFAIVGVL